jgi:hypothetical protein
MNTICKDDFARFKFLFKSNVSLSILQITQDQCYDETIVNYDVIVYKCNNNINDLLQVIDKCMFYMKIDSLFIIEHINYTEWIDILKTHLNNSIQKSKNITIYQLINNLLFTFRKTKLIEISEREDIVKTEVSYEKIKIVINSHKKSTIALNHLLESMKSNSDFLSFQHIIFIGGYYENKDYIINDKENIRYIYCNHNSIDFTSLIGLSEIDQYNQSNNYYFYMHDTCKIGDIFYKKLKNINLTNVTSIKIHGRYSMNIGVYSQKIINKFKDFLLTKKNTDEKKCMQFKTINYNEDYIFHNDTNNFLLENYYGWFPKGPLDYYNTGTMRIIEHYPNVDLYKIKANWGLGGEWTLNN